jgi:hypothetical protein
MSQFCFLFEVVNINLISLVLYSFKKKKQVLKMGKFNIKIDVQINE